MAKLGSIYIKLEANETLAGVNRINIDAQGSSSDVTGGDFSWTGSAWRYTWNVASGSDGDTSSIAVYATDVAGNVRNYSAPTSGGTVTIDATPPTAAITAPAAGTRIKGTNVITGTANDSNINRYVLEYYKAGTGPWTEISSVDNTNVNGAALTNWDTTGLNGDFNLRLTVFDKANNSSIANVTPLRVDNTAPSFDISYYSDFGLTAPLSNFGGKPTTRNRTIYIKVTPNETLNGEPVISINAPGTLNDRSNVTATQSGSDYVYSWNILQDTDGDASVTVSGQDLVGNISSNVIPSSGNLVTLDNSITAPVLSGAANTETNQVTLSWTTEADHATTYIYRSAIDGFTPDGSSLVTTVSGSAGSCVTVLLEGVHYYKTVAKDYAGNTSSESNQISAYRAVSAANAYVKYNNNCSYVTISVYWDDTNNSSEVLWANDVISSGVQLDWRSDGLNVTGLNTSNAIAVLGNAEKYKNYYFKINKGGKTSIIRAFPVDFDSDSGPRNQNDYAHGNFSPDTSMCSGCHSTHSALKAQLLKQATFYELCLLCHGTAATQSKYDVQSGKVKTADGWKYSLAGPVGADYGTSRHNVDDRSNVDTEVHGSAPGKILTFTCVSCHKGHGGTNDNYRLIREVIYPSNDKFVSTSVYYNAYAIVKDPVVGEELYMISGNTEFCTSCHLDYDDGSAWHQGGTYSSSYKHPVTVGNNVYSVYRSDPLRDWYPNPVDTIPLQVYNEGDSIGQDKRTAVVCSTCHYAHGTYKEFNMGYPQANGIPRENVSNQKMLRLNNYAVCESCHKK